MTLETDLNVHMQSISETVRLLKVIEILTPLDMCHFLQTSLSYRETERDSEREGEKES